MPCREVCEWSEARLAKIAMCVLNKAIIGNVGDVSG